MASTSSRNGHLDAFAGRAVVYCHQCQNEWYQDEDGLICPDCGCEATEIVSEENDPRNMGGGSSGADIDRDHDQDHHHNHNHDHDNHHHYLHDTDSDPDEADIEDTFRIRNGPGGFFSRHFVSLPPDESGRGNRSRTNPNDSDAILRRFSELISDVGGPPISREGPPRPGEANSHISTRGAQDPFSDPRVVQVDHILLGPGINANVSTFSMYNGPSSRTTRNGGDPAPPGSFQSVFGDIFGRVGPPPLRDNPNISMPGEAGGPDGRSADITALLNHLFASVLNPNAIHGDAVYSQEALDRIITNLMEANPQSNAPPPASAETIEKLPRKKLDEDMLGPELKGECTICIDDMKLGDEVVVLPCRHWFHDECVVLWLKEHNTCPICRAPIDGASPGQPSAAPSSSQGQSSSTLPSRPGPSRGASGGSRSNVRMRNDARLQSIRDAAGPYDRRTPSRRDSNSPPTDSVPAQPTRVRSTSPSSRHRSVQSEQTREAGGSSNNPLNWIRDQFRERRRS